MKLIQAIIRPERLEAVQQALRGGRLPLQRAMVLSRHLFEGLAAAHESGVIHRDLKPSNIRIDPAGEPPVRFHLRKSGRFLWVDGENTSRYSGGGFLLSQMLLEDVLGIPFAELAQRELFGPLGMTRTTFANPLSDSFVNSVGGDIASGHGDDGSPFPGGWAHAPEMGAGGLCSSARDYARFLLASGKSCSHSGCNAEMRSLI